MIMNLKKRIERSSVSELDVARGKTVNLKKRIES